MENPAKKTLDNYFEKAYIIRQDERFPKSSSTRKKRKSTRQRNKRPTS